MAAVESSEPTPIRIDCVAYCVIPNWWTGLWSLTKGHATILEVASTGMEGLSVTRLCFLPIRNPIRDWEWQKDCWRELDMTADNSLRLHVVRTAQCGEPARTKRHVYVTILCWFHAFLAMAVVHTMCCSPKQEANPGVFLDQWEPLDQEDIPVPQQHGWEHVSKSGSSLTVSSIE